MATFVQHLTKEALTLWLEGQANIARGAELSALGTRQVAQAMLMSQQMPAEADQATFDIVAAGKALGLDKIVAHGPSDETTMAQRGKKRAARVKTDKPKKLSGYLLFCAEKRPSLDKALFASVPDVSRHLGQEWSKLTDDEKKVYNDRAQKEFVQRMQAYDAAHPITTTAAPDTPSLTATPEHSPSLPSQSSANAAAVTENGQPHTDADSDTSSDTSSESDADSTSDESDSGQSDSEQSSSSESDTSSESEDEKPVITPKHAIDMKKEKKKNTHKASADLVKTPAPVVVAQPTPVSMKPKKDKKHKHETKHEEKHKKKKNKTKHSS